VCLKTLKEADFAEVSFNTRKFTAGVSRHVKGKEAAVGVKGVKDALQRVP
jgi:hypothetical protein